MKCHDSVLDATRPAAIWGSPRKDSGRSRQPQRQSQWGLLSTARGPRSRLDRRSPLNATNPSSPWGGSRGGRSHQSRHSCDGRRHCCGSRGRECRRGAMCTGERRCLHRQRRAAFSTADVSLCVLSPAALLAGAALAATEAAPSSTAPIAPAIQYLSILSSSKLRCLCSNVAALALLLKTSSVDLPGQYAGQLGGSSSCWSAWR